MTVVNILNRQVKKVANGVIDERGRFFPFFIQHLSPASGINLPANTQRMFIGGISGYCRTVAGDGTTYQVCSGISQRRTIYLGAMALVPGVAQNVHLPWSEINVLLDEGTTVSWGTDNAPSAGNFMLKIALVDDV